MGKLTWRWIVILLVIFGWSISLWPPTDRDFLQTMETQAKKEGQKPDAKFEEIINRARVIMSENSSISPMKAVANAADELHIELSNYIPIYGRDMPSNQEVLQYVRRLSRGKLRLGLDLSGGTEFVVAFSEDDMPEDRSVGDIQDQLMEIIRNRVDKSGVLEPEIVPYGPTGISVKIPTIDEDDTNKFKELLTRAAVLEFRMVHPESGDFEQLERERQQEDPDYVHQVLGYERKVHEYDMKGQSRREVLWLSTEEQKLSGQNITDAHPTAGEFGQLQIAFTLDTEGAIAFGELTGANVGQRMAIVLDGTVYSAPNINDRIGGGRGVITGSFTQDEASQLAIVLKSGNLPVQTRLEGVNMTAPTLGIESIRSGAMAAVVGIILVILFMVTYYFRSGVIATIALVLNMLIVMGTLPILDATITLPGLAGIVLTIGMAVDANVLIFERIREELKTGKSIQNAISRGYSSAFSTILDANLTTLFTAFILVKFGSGPIKGFGVTLSIGIIASMFTALFVTRTIYDTLLKYDLIHKLRMMQFLEPGHVRFFDYRKLAYLVSAGFILLALITIVVRGGSALSVDFRGGTAISFQYEETVSNQQIAKTLEQNEQLGVRDVRVNYKSSTLKEGRLMEVVVTKQFSDEVDPGTLIAGIINAAHPEMKARVASVELVGAMVGSQFTWSAIKAVILALIMIIIYIAIRFEFSYAIGAVVCLAHDVIIGLGIYLMWGFGDRQISLTVIAAILTIIGYSLNDTIVVFDRIRENVGLLRKTNFAEICSISINQTLSRTILTSLTTLLVVVILYLFGGGAINDFSLIMMVGIVVGTYSSIFVATPVMIYIQTRVMHKKSLLAEGASTSKTPA